MSPDTPGVLGSERSAPLPNGFVGHGDPAFGQEIFDISKAQCEAVIKPHRLRDDIERKAVSTVIWEGGHAQIVPNDEQPDKTCFLTSSDIQRLAALISPVRGESYFVQVLDQALRVGHTDEHLVGFAECRADRIREMEQRGGGAAQGVDGGRVSLEVASPNTPPSELTDGSIGYGLGPLDIAERELLSEKWNKSEANPHPVTMDAHLEAAEQQRHREKQRDG